jgi:hypothetical protein
VVWDLRTHAASSISFIYAQCIINKLVGCAAPMVVSQVRHAWMVGIAYTHEAFTATLSHPQVAGRVSRSPHMSLYGARQTYRRSMRSGLFPFSTITHAWVIVVKNSAVCENRANEGTSYQLLQGDLLLQRRLQDHYPHNTRSLRRVPCIPCRCRHEP